MYLKNDLVMAIDISANGNQVIGIIGGFEHILKRKEFLRKTSWIKHYREISAREKHIYIVLFPRRFKKIESFLSVVKICRNIACANDVIGSVTPAVILIDDKLYNNFHNLASVVIKESRIYYRHHRRLCLLADNLANYFRILLKRNPRRYLEELKRFEKII